MARKSVMQNISISRRKKSIILLVLCLAGSLIYLNPRFSPMENNWTKNIDFPVAKEYSKHKMKEKIILYWNTFYGVPDMYYGTGNSIFQSCNYTNCFATYNKTYLPIEQFDAIIFHGARYSFYSDGYPSKRSLHQKYIYYSLESPYNTNFEKNTRNFYNWTMTYRKDSDIHSPYGLTVKSSNNYDMPTIEDVNNKTQMVAWFASNCYTLGSRRRMKYATELGKFIPVDIYGKCGKLTCKEKNYCYEMLEKNYKFYLSFENSICKDYVTEKLFNILHYNVVPIVLGFFDYSDIAPPYSVINTNDFKHPQDLAEYLLFLDKNVTEYLKYFEWKKSYSVQENKQYTLCHLCRMLNMPLKYYSYEDVKEWFYGFNCYQ